VILDNSLNVAPKRPHQMVGPFLTIEDCDKTNKEIKELGYLVTKCWRY